MDKIAELKKVDDQIPNPYKKGVWYDVKLPGGKAAQAMRTKPGYLRIKKLVRTRIVDTAGNFLRYSGDDYIFFRANLKTGKITQV